MHLIELNPDYFTKYEEFLERHEGAMIYYSTKFKRFLEKITNSISNYYLAVDEKNEIQGILPLMIKDGRYGKILNSLPYYGSNGGILSASKEATRMLLDKYIELCDSQEFASSTLIENPLDLNYDYDQIPSNEHDYRIGQLTDISGQFIGLEDLMIKFHYKTRNIIRKALKSGVHIEIDNDKFDFLEATHVDNMMAIGGLAKSSKFFEAIQECFEPGKDYNLYIAKYDGLLVAATLVLYFGKVVEYYTPVIVKEYRSLQPLSLIIAQSMLEANAKGFHWWNWGGTWKSQSGVYDFKSKWGTFDIDYHYHVKINNEDIYNVSKAELLDSYSGFFVLPFGSLKSR